jgi:hypothetical protein
MSLLVVPIDVAALAVSPQPLPANTGFMPAMTMFDQLPYDPNGTQLPFVSEHALAQPFDGGNLTPNPGVHLHWAMPDALTRGTRPVGPDGKPVPGSAPQFPALPDRWLVTRTALVDGKPGGVRSWVVDSRFVSAGVNAATFNIGSNAVPWQDPTDTTGTTQPYQFLGRAVPLDAWASAPHDPNACVATLDVTSLAMVELPAYYPNTVNVFGLHDPLDDLGGLQQVELSYAVTGWHTRTTDDPLAGRNAADAVACLGAMKWKADAPGPFDATTYCGCVIALTWHSDLVPPAPGPLTATIGNNTTEALSALLVHAGPSALAASPDSDQIEFQLNTLLSGQLSLLSDPAGPRQVTRQLHQQRFSPVPLGSVWFVRRKSDGTDISGQLANADGAKLDALNGLQAAVDRLRAIVNDKQWQLYADWYKYLVLAYPPRDLDPSGAAMDYLQNQRLPDLQNMIATYDTQLGDVQTAATALVASLNAGPLSGTFDLTSKPGQFFYRPADPTLLLSGPDVTPALRYGGDHLASENGLLACRVSSSLVTGVTAPAGAVAGATAASVAAIDLSFIAVMVVPQLDATMAGLAQAFARETVLLWPNGVAGLLTAKAGGAVKAWQDWARQQVTAFVAGTGPSSAVYQGTPPSPVGVELSMGNPWLPIIMHWQMTYWPNQIVPAAAPTQVFAADLVLSRLVGENDSLDDSDTDLVLTGAPGAAACNYQGITFITPHAGYSVLQQLTDYAKANRNSPLAPLAAEVTALPLLSQSLAGFHDRFLLKRKTLQIEVRDPFAQGDDEFALIAGIRQALAAVGGRASSMAPMAEDAFCPVRGGMTGLTLLRLVDAFGQFRQYSFGGDDNAVVPARSLAPSRMFVGQATAPAFMPPRLSQPAALNAAWLAADDSGVIGTRMTTTPICGWAVPNYLDESLMIYDADGTALGAITRDTDRPWQGSPSDAVIFSQSVDEVFAHRNPHLRGFVTALIGRGADYLDAIDGASTTIQPLGHAQSVQLPVLVGQPLALVRAQISLELAGTVAINNTWDAFTKDMADPTGARTTNGLGKVAFPVLLGSVDDPDDGLIGFYLDGTDPFGTFHAVGPGSGSSVPARKIDTVAMSIADAPTALTCLIDPRCPMHATTGYLPTQSMQIPTEMFRDAVARMAVTFLTAPILVAHASKTGSIALPLPLPGRQAGNWSFVDMAVDASGTQIPEATPVVALDTKQVFGKASYQLKDGWLSLQGFEE